MSNRKIFLSFEEITEEDELIDIADISNPEDVLQDNYLETDEKDITDLSDTIDETDEIITTMESINKIVIDHGSIGQTDAKLISIAIEHFCKRMNYTKKAMPAMEAFGGTMTKVEGTKLAIEGIKEFAKAAWEAIKKAFNTILEWIKNFFNKVFDFTKSIYNGLNKSLKDLDELNEHVSSTLKKNISTEDSSPSEYDINKPLTMHVGNFGSYLGNNKKDIITYIEDLKDIDSSILDIIKHSNSDLDISISHGSIEFKHPFTLEQKEFFKGKVPFSTTVAKVVPLSFKKGFIWKIEGTSIHSTKDTTETLQVNAGVERINYTYDIEEIDVLTIGEIKTYLTKLKYDLESDGRNTHMLASKVLKSINEKLKEIEKLSSSNASESEEEYKANREKFTKAKQSLNALKNIEVGYWQYKNQTTVKIKEYCDASIKARRKDYSDFNKV